MLRPAFGTPLPYPPLHAHARWTATATTVPPPPPPPPPPAPEPSRRGRRAAAPSAPPAPVVKPVFRSENTGDAWDATPVTSAPLWRLLLMSDGDLEGHLQAVTSGDLRLELVESTLLAQVAAERPEPAHHPPVADLPWPRRQRQVRLLDAHRRVLVHATSVWDAALYDHIMGADEARTTWEALNTARFGTARKVLGVQYGRCAAFGRDELLWARDLLLKRDRRPMVVVREILSPALARYLGPMTPPLEGYADALARTTRELQ
jgi:chorismate-pyruvate lyase